MILILNTKVSNTADFFEGSRPKDENSLCFIMNNKLVFLDGEWVIGQSLSRLIITSRSFWDRFKTTSYFYFSYLILL